MLNNKKNDGATEKSSDSNTKTTASAPAKKDVVKKASDSKSQKASNKTKKKTERKGLRYLTGVLFRKMAQGGANELCTNADEVNKLNVFPVPDGDTGDNMRMTIESGVAAIENITSNDLSEVMKSLSHGMLLGARGNSGVILSQFFTGLAKGLESSKRADPETLGKALESGVEQAYASVMTPTEGTILTVARESVEYAVSRLNAKSTIRSFFADLVKEMHASLERTPSLLPQLKEAGVVDSGAAGLFYIMDGFNRALNGKPVVFESQAHTAPAHSEKSDIFAFGPDSEMVYGYCSEFLLRLQNSKTDIDAFDIEELKKFLSDMGDSIVAFKNDSIVKVHVHTFSPELVMAHLRKFGEFLSVKIENMSVQHTEASYDKVEKENTTPDTEIKKTAPKKPHGIVSVSNGPGIEAVLRELGADEIISGGQTHNPSTNEFLEAFAKINADNIFVFPNNGNILMAAEQAAEIYKDAKVFVIPSKTIGTGYVALASADFSENDPEVIKCGMLSAMERVCCGLISPAIRDAEMNGISIKSGNTIGIIGKDIVVSEEKLTDATSLLADILLSMDGKFMLTVFCGKDSSAEECLTLENYVKEHHPDDEIYFIDGGQEIYPFILVAE